MHEDLPRMELVKLPPRMSGPERAEQIVVALMLCHALSREEAEHYLRMHDARKARDVVNEVMAAEEPKVFHLPLKWWRMGRDAVVYVLLRDFGSAHMADQQYNEKGHKKP